MQTNKEELKKILDKAIKDDLEYRNGLDNYETITNSITDHDYFVLFDVMEAHYLAHAAMNEYQKDMYWLVREVMLLYYLCRSSMTVAEVMANAIDARHYYNFDKREIQGIGEELVERINGKEYFEENGFELMSFKSAVEKGKGKRKVISIKYDHKPFI